ncbi:hypothetical protein GCM10023191_092390 [Actinoallomurus oryzae]|uniref:Uncharacterized protein n=1 Tax=Actinoallomurus oryzae TaxID=502180 RepID=A0ABP8R4Y9_9ACTN
MTADLDWRRFPYEVTRALDRESIMLEQLEPGLRAAYAPGEIVVLDHSGETELCRVPHYRLALPDPERLRRAAAKALENLPDHLADQCVAAINDEAIELRDPPESEWIEVYVQIGPDARVPLFRAHRCVVVPDWPRDVE